MSTLKIGIDKMELSSRDFEIEAVKPSIFGIDKTIRQGASTEELPMLLQDLSGNIIHANKIYHNSEHLGITISQHGMKVSFNPNKILHPYLLTAELNSDSYFSAIKVVEAEMQQAGIHVSLDNMRLQRVDLAKQTEMQHPCFQYHQAFSLMQGRRMKQRCYEGGYLFGNQSHQTIFYDKEQELSYQGISHEMQGEKNLLRAEIRALKKGYVKSMLHSNHLHELKKLSQADVAETYSKHLEKKIFTLSDPDNQIEIPYYEHEVQTLKWYLSKYGRQGTLMHLLAAGSVNYIQALGGINIYGRMLSDAGCNRYKVNRELKKINKIISEKGSRDAMKEINSAEAMIHELKVKFAA